MESCPLCNDLKKKPSRARIAFDFPPDKLTARATCAVCRVIYEAIRSMEDATWRFSKDVSWVYATANVEKNETLCLEVYFKDDRPKYIFELFFRQGDHLEDNEELCAIKPRSSISGHPLSESGLVWLKSQLETCVTSHPSCSGRPDVVAPKRLLSFIKVPSGEIKVYLKETNGVFPESPVWSFPRITVEKRYAALSHCWGDHQSCTTHDGNLKKRKEGIPWPTIPKTFQDAIKFCLKLGIHFLWIDALCIIQDNAADWETESAKMADIYENAFVTLAATRAKSDRDGCFDESVVSAPEHVLEAKLPGISHNVVYQIGMGQYAPSHSETRPGSHSTFDNQLEVSKQWQAVVGQYSLLKLTNESDRLPALSGLASRAARQLGRYYCGLWSATFTSDLLWRVDALNKDSCRHAPYRGPIWSWVSVTSGISYWESLGLDITARNSKELWQKMSPSFEAGNIELRGRNPFGEVVSGGVIVYDLIQPAHLVYPSPIAESTEERVWRVHDQSRYEIKTPQLEEWPLFADHKLSSPGPDYVKEGKTLYQLLVHPCVALVLEGLIWHVQKMPVCRRIGIIKFPDSVSERYGGQSTWKRCARKGRIILV
ncbi:HET-domain-containing [Fusarium albosuccineum]|uniref:HET-domain-containing n=1 Tax=Fusarium albosuccineum TaxID=1237068 RepID=A0A8H4L2L8_9HYPO|nr:HET-domain-containing [Fusarium albosuccineum]